MRARPSLAFLAILVAGCAAVPATDPGPTLSPAAGPVLAIEACATDCFEPSVAVDDEGRIFVTSVAGEFARSVDGGASFEPLDAPPLPSSLPVDSSESDVVLQTDASGRLHFSSLVLRGRAATGQPVLEGLHVAWTEDGGATWPVNTYIGAADDPTANVYYPDRQWLGFAPDGTLYLTYNQIPSGIWSARSDDEGKTWGSWVRALPPEARMGGAGQSGPPVVDSSGAVFVPGCSLDGEHTFVARSRDRGASYESLPVVTGTCSWFPVAMVDDDDRLVLAVHVAEGSGQIVVFSSEDQGDSWTPGIEWGSSTPTGPWPLAGPDGGWLVVWFHRAAKLTLEATLGGPKGPTSSTEVAVVGDATASEATHFAHGALLPDGRVATVWAAGPKTFFQAASVSR